MTTVVTGWSPHWWFLKKGSWWGTKWPRWSVLVMRSARYDRWWLVLTVVILKLILSRMISLCSSLRTGLMWSRRRAHVTTRARQFWTLHCNFSRFDLDWTYAKLVCILFVSSTSDIVLNPNAGAFINYSQSAKDIGPYFKSELCEGPVKLKAGTHFTEWA